jgi:hypothetical protein
VEVVVDPVRRYNLGTNYRTVLMDFSSDKSAIVLNILRNMCAT